MGDIEIQGLDSLLKKIEQLGGNIEVALKKGIGQATKKVQADAKRLTPVDTGNLRNSITTSVMNRGRDGIIGSVGTVCEYAPFVEFGTGIKGGNSPSPPKYDGPLDYRADWVGVPAQPFLWPAFAQNKTEIQALIKEGVKTEIARLASRRRRGR